MDGVSSCSRYFSIHSSVWPCSCREGLALQLQLNFSLSPLTLILLEMGLVIRMHSEQGVFPAFNLEGNICGSDTCDTAAL